MHRQLLIKYINLGYCFPALELIELNKTILRNIDEVVVDINLRCKQIVHVNQVSGLLLCLYTFV